MKKRTFRRGAAALSALAMSLLLAALSVGARLPDQYYVANGSALSLFEHDPLLSADLARGSFPLAVYRSSGNSFPVQLRMLGLAVKEVDVQVVDRRVVQLGGTPFGIKLTTDGVMVVGMGQVQTQQENLVNPAWQAGIREGDVILSLDGRTVSSKKEVSQAVADCDGRPVEVTYRRGEQLRSCSVQPVRSQLDGQYHLGLWVRDSSAGIGTLTFRDPDTGAFAGLGHAICDVDTGQIMPLSQGQIVSATITGVQPGAAGAPGQLQGTFTSADACGKLLLNSAAGVYGRCDDAPAYAQTIPLAQMQEVRPGPAKMVTTIQGQKPRWFDIEIERVSLDRTEPTRNMVVHIVDPELLEASGGIVQGMSGSPIVQDGMLVGAVTHVFVNDPTRGYGIFAENMYSTMSSLPQAG